jgi:protein involved in polysaccharide export with SLBB domain
MRAIGVHAMPPGRMGSCAMTALILLVACQPELPTESLAPAVETRSREYVMGAGDAVRITVFDNAGQVQMPLIGSVRAEGRTLVDFKSEIENRLRGGYLVNPRVVVDVTEYRPIYVLGAVSKPGIVPYTPGITILGAIAASGGHAATANLSAPPVITRSDDPTKTSRPTAVGELVYPGDIIEVPITGLFR